jgi:hypothetical protein
MTDEDIFDYLVTRYGIGYTRLTIHCSIGADGSALITRDVELIARSTLENLDIVMIVPANQDGTWNIPSVEIYSAAIERRVEIVQERADSLRQSALMRITPPLQAGDWFRYTTKEQLPEKFYAFSETVDELQKSKEKGELFGLSDYFGWNINRPTRQLNLEISFPDGWTPVDDGVKVLYATASSFPSTREQSEEAQRVRYERISSTNNRYQIKLESRHPMIGLIYIITWLPIYEKKISINKARSSPDETLTYKDYQKIVNILAKLPSLETAGARQTLLFLAGVDAYIEADLNGSAQMVAGMIVHQLTKYGQIEDGEPGETALGRLLQYLTSYAVIPLSDKKALDQIFNKLQN